MNNSLRKLWVENNTTLRNFHRSTYLSVGQFIKEYREGVDNYITSRGEDTNPSDTVPEGEWIKINKQLQKKG